MLFSALGNGSTVVPTQAEDIYVKASSCSVMAATPSILSNLPRATSNSSIFASIHTVILGGETAASDLLESWVDAGVRVLVGYGATETTSMGSVHVVARDLKTQTINPSLIGGSIEQSPIWLVNCDFQPIEDELLEGEIIISGECISRGYYQDDIKTDDSFIYWNSLRVYKTGDYGRWVRGPSGDRVVEFRGRKDRTVKNGGFLVNLDRDVENALYHAGMSLGVTSVYAAVTEDGIVAVVTPKSVDVIALLTKARQTMCSYCIPYRLEALQKFPMSSNGKVQQKRVLEIISAIDCGKDLDLYTTTPSSLAAEGSNTESMEEQAKLSKILSAASSVFGYSEGKSREIKGSDSFPKLGGSSLLAFKLISILRLHNLRIIPKDLFSCRTFEEIAKEATNISFSDYEVPGADGNSIITQKLTALRKQARDILGLADESFDIGPLASLQLVLAVPTLSNKSKNVNQVKLTYSGAYASMMERAWRIVWQAEPVFRTEISLAIGCGAQIIYRQPFRKPIKELYSSLADYDAAVKEVNVNVGLGCSLEFIVYRPATSSEITAAADAAAISKLAEELTIVLTVHHSLMDGVSLQILLTKVERAARGWPLPFSVDSTKANLGLISIQQNRDVAARNFFSEYLKKSQLKNGLYNNCNSIVQGEGSSARQDNTILLRSPVKNEEIADFARRSCVSTACIYYTAWAMAMSAIERDSTVIIGSVFSNRGLQPEFEDTIGLYISTLPLVIKLDDDESVVSLLQQVMSDIITIGQYAWASSDQIGIGSRVRSLVSIQPLLPNENSNPPAIRVESLESSDFPLSLLIESTGEFRIVYDGHVFNKTTIRRLGGHFKHALRGILHYALVGECRKINELLEMVYEQSEEVKIERDTQTVKQALEASIDRFQDFVAIEDYQGTSLTYGQLDEQTNIIASRINERLADPDSTAIAVYGDGSIEWLLGLLAILKTGRAFVPIDPKWPMERKMMVLEASGAAAILIPDSFHRSQVPKVAEREILVVKTLLSRKSSERETARLPDLGSADSVLVFIFTSGTTGVPKGIPTTNQSFLALQSNPEATMFAAPGRRIAQFMSPAFDVCSVEIFSALLHGATLVLRDPEDPFAHLSRVNTAIMTPAVLSVLKPDEFPNIEIVSRCVREK
jgi:non-ribosomal peptide synthetase component F